MKTMYEASFKENLMCSCMYEAAEMCCCCCYACAVDMMERFSLKYDR